MIRHGIQGRLLRTFLVLVLLPLLVFGFIAIQTSRDAIQQQATDAEQKSVSVVRERIDTVLMRIVGVSNEFFLDNDVNKLIIQGVQDGDLFRTRLAHDYLRQISARTAYQTGEYRHHIRVIGFRGIDYRSWDMRRAVDDLAALRDKPWFDQLHVNPGRVHWLIDAGSSVIHSDTGEPMIVGVRLMQHLFTGEPIGLLAIGVRQSVVERLVASSLQETRSAYVLHRGSVPVASVNPITGADLAQIASRIERRSGISSTVVREGLDGNYLLTCGQLNVDVFSIAVLTPMRLLLLPAIYWQRIMLLMLVAFLVLAVAAAYRISLRFTAPIRQLADDMAAVSAGHLQKRTGVRTTDEIGDLALSFNSMLDRIDGLVQNLVREHRERMEATIHALTNQMNPHFLYNTLAGIRFMIGRRPAEDLDRALASLVRFLHYALSERAELVTARDELGALRHYCDIQTVRSGGRTRFEFETEAAALDATLPKLTLQPLVENAIFHGLSSSGDEGTVTVRALAIGEEAVFEIEDRATHPRRVAARAAPPVYGGAIGISNINERLAYHFGPSSKVVLNSCDGSGTVATFRVPGSPSTVGEHK